MLGGVQWMRCATLGSSGECSVPELYHQPEKLGVSVVICCHNSEGLLPATITHLKTQRFNEQDWEVLVIDNASVDRTPLVARECWGEDSPVAMRIVHEPRLGLSFARERAFEEARYEVLSFIDDDNWIAPGWIATVSECMSANPKLGAIGSINTAVADSAFPDWFARYCHYYAAWAYHEPATLASWVLNGAGMTIRKKAWRELRTSGFKWRLTDRCGSRLSSGGDLELGCAIQLAGWKIRIEPRLRLEHYMTPERLRWSYLRELLRRSGEAYVVLDSYLLVSQIVNQGLINRLRQCWWIRLAKETMHLLCSHSVVKMMKASVQTMEGDDEIADLEVRLGRLFALARLRSSYGRIRRDVANAPWRVGFVEMNEPVGSGVSLAEPQGV
jgi:glycosyltransferase involved in cell wall biosynthesis